MLEKHITATTSHKQHDHFNSSSPEPRLKIKISRLKDGSASFSLHNGFNIPDNSTRSDLNRNNFNHSHDNYNDGDETEDDYNQLDYLNAPKKSRLDVKEFTVQAQNGEHKHHNERGKYSDKENKIALRSRISRNKIEEDFDVSKNKTFQRKFCGKKSVGCSTEGDLLGPCQPGTLIKLPGLVWSESSENGMLLFKTMWKDKPFVGMLMEVGQGEEWSISKSRIFASCPGSRYKRKCKKPREFRYVDNLQKKNKNVRSKAKSGWNCSEDSHSTNEDESSVDQSQYLTCQFNGCRKKFVNKVARGFHISHAHSVLSVDEDELKTIQKRDARIPSDFGGRVFKNTFSPRRKDRILSIVGDCSTNEDVNFKRQICQSSDDDDTNLSSTASLASFVTISDGIRAGQHDRNNLVEDISDDDDNDIEIGDTVVHPSRNMFYTSALNPTSLIIRRAVKTSDLREDMQINDDDDDPDNKFKSSFEPHNICTQAVITSSGSMSSLTSSSFAPTYGTCSLQHYHLESSMPMPARSPNLPIPESSWLDHYPHSISAALTMSLLSMSKTPLHDLALDSEARSVTERHDEHLSTSKDDETFKHSPSTITTKICDVFKTMAPSPLAEDVTMATNQNLLSVDFASQGGNVPNMDRLDEESQCPDNPKTSCISPVYSDISDTVDQTPLFANTSRVIDVKTPPPVVVSSYFGDQYERLPGVTCPEDTQSKVADWLISEENIESGVYFDGYTSYLQQILCNKEKFYMSLAFSSPSNSPQRFNPDLTSNVSPISNVSKASDQNGTI